MDGCVGPLRSTTGGLSFTREIVTKTAQNWESVWLVMVTVTVL